MAERGVEGIESVAVLGGGTMGGGIAGHLARAVRDRSGEASTSATRTPARAR